MLYPLMLLWLVVAFFLPLMLQPTLLTALSMSVYMAVGGYLVLLVKKDNVENMPNLRQSHPDLVEYVSKFVGFCGYLLFIAAVVIPIPYLLFPIQK